MTSLLHPLDAPLTSLDKGVPPLAQTLPIEKVKDQSWNLLREDIPLPAAIINSEALKHNSEWMKDFLKDTGAYLAPHGKTTMSPALFDLQVADGAWAITVSTLHQLQVARAFGHKRIFYANQLVGRVAIDHVVQELAADPAFEFFCIVDSMQNAEALARSVQKSGSKRPIEVLVEVGYNGGRTGCRSLESAIEIARFIKTTEGALSLRGIEGFEGLIRGKDSASSVKLVEALMDTIVELARRCDEEDLYSSLTPILSAGGSSYYDIVVEKLSNAGLSRQPIILVRSGCYITHDSVLYVKAVNALRERNVTLAEHAGGLKPALTVWAYVQSRPEEGTVIAAMGKRDISYDDHPVPLTWFRPDSEMEVPATLSEDHLVTKLNDQHCYVSVPATSPLKVGDMIAFGISHPCLTFDKWRVLHIADNDFNITSSIRTYF